MIITQISIIVIIISIVIIIIKVSEAYKGRASLPNYEASPADLTLQLDELLYNDTGFYRCEVQQGLEDAHDLVQIKVKGKQPCPGQSQR